MDQAGQDPGGFAELQERVDALEVTLRRLELFAQACWAGAGLLVPGNVQRPVPKDG